jgi:hypothetical protein
MFAQLLLKRVGVKPKQLPKLMQFFFSELLKIKYYVNHL